MRRFALFSLPLAALSGLLTPAVAADLDGPLYGQRDFVIERPAPRSCASASLSAIITTRSPATRCTPMRRPIIIMRQGPMAVLPTRIDIIGTPGAPSLP